MERKIFQLRTFSKSELIDSVKFLAGLLALDIIFAGFLLGVLIELGV